jgi:hypothetical protein
MEGEMLRVLLNTCRWTEILDEKEKITYIVTNSGGRVDKNH